MSSTLLPYSCRVCGRRPVALPGELCGPCSSCATRSSPAVSRESELEAEVEALTDIARRAREALPTLREGEILRDLCVVVGAPDAESVLLSTREMVRDVGRMAHRVEARELALARIAAISSDQMDPVLQENASLRKDIAAAQDALLACARLAYNALYPEQPYGVHRPAPSDVPEIVRAALERGART